jgi:hypothetical protein
MKTKIKTIDVNAKEWFDRVNGNSYFAGTVTINYGMKTQKSFAMPFQCGYGDQYRHEAFKQLQEKKFIPAQDNTSFWRYYDENGIISRHSIQVNCLKRELLNIE